MPSSSPAPFRGRSSSADSITFYDPKTHSWLSLDEQLFPNTLDSGSKIPPNSFLGECSQRIWRLKEESLKGHTADRLAAAREIIQFARYDNLALHSRILAALQQLGEPAVVALREALPAKDDTIKRTVLLALGAIERRRRPESQAESVTAIANELAQAGDAPWRTAALTALRYIGSDSAKAGLVKLLNASSRAEALPLIWELGLFRAPALIEPVLRHLFTGPQAPPLTPTAIPLQLSFLVNPQMLSENLSSPLGRALAVRFGYLDHVLAARMEHDRQVLWPVRSLLRELGVATEELVSALTTAPEELASWAALKAEFEWQLLPSELANRPTSARVGVDAAPASRRERQILFAALRSLDNSNIQSKAEPNPFDREHQAQLPGRFFYQTCSYFEQTIVPRYLSEIRAIAAEETPDQKLIETLLPYFLPLRAGVDSETDGEKSAEMRCMLAAKIRTALRITELHEQQLVLRPAYVPFFAEAAGKDWASADELITAICNERCRELWKLGLLDPAALTFGRELISRHSAAEAWRGLTGGAQSALQLQAYQFALRNPRTAEAEWLASLERLTAAERFGREHLPSVGIEIQNPTVSEKETYLWKPALESFGIPSPRRLEYYSLVEASFKPAYSGAVFETAAQALFDLGFHRKPDAPLVLHISIGGDLKDEGKLLALGLQAAAPQRKAEEISRDNWYASISKVMSKGLVYRNYDSVDAITGEQLEEVHTEIRVVRLERAAGPDGSQYPALNLISTTQELAAAAYAWLDRGAGIELTEPQKRLAAIWARYHAALTALYSDPYFGSQALLEVDWSRGTGDSRETKLVPTLPLVQALESVQAFFKGHPDRESELKARAYAIFSDCVREAGGIFSALRAAPA